MRKFFKSLFNLDLERSICVKQEILGGEKVIRHRDKRYRVKIPPKINKKITLRLKGLGKKRGAKIGDLYLHIWLNKGENTHKNLWISETSARSGTKKLIRIGGRKIWITIPPYSYSGLTIRLKGLGKEPKFSRQVSAAKKIRGNLMVKLFTFPDQITPSYGTLETLTTSDMYLEGWVYRKFDEVIKNIGYKSLPSCPLEAEHVADIFNQSGWRGVFQTLLDHVNLKNTIILLDKSNTLSRPGRCEGTQTTSSNNTAYKPKYQITINENFIDNPFSTAAILAHELCHVIHAEKILKGSTPMSSSQDQGKELLENERMVDLLVFMYRMGEFQLRVARDSRLTLGYFNQKIFERMQVIVSKKIDSVHVDT
jgi:hypothetical protein